MTAPTGQGDGREQETCSNCTHVRTAHSVGGCHVHVGLFGGPVVCRCRVFTPRTTVSNTANPVTQQPPAQEREVEWPCVYSDGECIREAHKHAPLSEADSAGEDGNVALRRAREDLHLLARTLTGTQQERAYLIGDLLNHVWLAASPGVQGGDGKALAATNPAGGLERDGDAATDVGARLAAVLALHVEGPYKDCRECSRAWPCPTVRAAGGSR